jgi:hypothetical protein
VPIVIRFRHLAVVVGLALCFIAGYLFAEWWSDGSNAGDSTALTQICARVDYVNSLQESLPEQKATSEEVRNEFSALVEQCRRALREEGEEND